MNHFQNWKNVYLVCMSLSGQCIIKFGYNNVKLLAYLILAYMWYDVAFYVYLDFTELLMNTRIF